jgi:hypothetical protein
MNVVARGMFHSSLAVKSKCYAIFTKVFCVVEFSNGYRLGLFVFPFAFPSPHPAAP